MKLTVINTNARSLRPKITSLIDSIRELEASFAVVTETWFSEDSRLELEAENLLLGSGISMLTKNRELTDRGIAHGGVAILARDNVTKMKVFDFGNPEKFEVLPVVASLHGLKRKIFFVCCYIPPGYNDLVLEAKDKLDEPYICVTGDFNQ